jgi:hypothetical protein
MRRIGEVILRWPFQQPLTATPILARDLAISDFSALWITLCIAHFSRSLATEMTYAISVLLHCKKQKFKQNQFVTELCESRFKNIGAALAIHAFCA